MIELAIVVNYIRHTAVAFRQSCTLHQRSKLPWSVILFSSSSGIVKEMLKAKAFPIYYFVLFLVYFFTYYLYLINLLGFL